MEIKITKCSNNEVEEANIMLNELIVDEKKYDKNINSDFVVKNYYERYLNDENTCLLIAKQENKIIGYVFGYVREDKDLVLNKVCVLDALFVKKNYRNQGVAKKLINSFKSWGIKKEARYVELKVWKDNDLALNLYKNSGLVVSKYILLGKLEEK